MASDSIFFNTDSVKKKSATKEGDDKTNASIESKTFQISIAVAIAVIIFLATMTASFASWKTSQDEHIAALEKRCQIVSEDVDELEKRANDNDVQRAMINAKLANIEALLIEIKQDIKEKHT